ncbi:MAG TPA: hypothetical protein VII06_36195 [Chloroflexota bacterium]
MPAHHGHGEPVGAPHIMWWWCRCPEDPSEPHEDDESPDDESPDDESDDAEALVEAMGMVAIELRPKPAQPGAKELFQAAPPQVIGPNG